MRVILNLLWLIFAGLATAISYVLAGIVACIFIVTIPFGVACFRLAGYALWPFGRTVVRRPDAGAMSAIGNVVWFVFVGWWLALSQLLYGLALMCTIIGIPFGWAVWKLAGLSLFPLGRDVVESRYAGWVPVSEGAGVVTH
jgi:uncharacterized membrane protein YccF (DUF307 family)